MSDAEKSPLEAAIDQAMDAFVYAPIGLLFEGPELFPKLAEKGRNQVHVARMMGEMAVQMGQREAEKRLARTNGPLREAFVAMGMAPPSEGPPAAKAPAAKAETTKTASKRAQATKTASRKAPATKTASRKAPATKRSAGKAPAESGAPAAEPTPASPSLGIPDYDSLSASQVVKRLQGMAESELDAIRAYEAATRARKTILNRITQLQKD